MSAMPAPSDWISVKEAAEVVGRSRETVRRWVWSGELRSLRRGRRHLLPKAELEIVAAAKGRPAAPSLARWTEEAGAALSAGGSHGRPSAKDLVLEDRTRRR